MAQADNAAKLIVQAGECIERASDTPGFGTEEERTWIMFGQVQATLAVATALLAVDDTLRLLVRKT